MNRRELIAAAAALPIAGCGAGQRALAGLDSGADMARGHRLRQGGFPAPSRAERAGIVIVGGGVAGLAAGWALADAGFDDLLLLELEDETGGNARAGGNAVSAYPLGAHYLPVLNAEAVALKRMLTQFGMITGEKAGLPVYDPYQLCADLDERLLFRGRWQEGLLPREGLTDAEAREMLRFEAATTDWRDRIGADGRPAFAVPTALSSGDPDIRALDDRSFTDWLDAERFTAPPLRTHIRYCTRDDYGCEPEHVSAWAGLHYFAARRGVAADGAGDNQLTWPEGNARLTRLMAARFSDRIATSRIAFSVDTSPWRRPGPQRPLGPGSRQGPGPSTSSGDALRASDGVFVDNFDTRTGTVIRTEADAVILALPRFVAHRIAPALGPAPEGLDYSPWLVANITVDALPAGRGAPLAWDNVSATSESLGYVVATHQSLASRHAATVLTWYMPLSRLAPADARRELATRPPSHWRRLVEADLLVMHPELDGQIRAIDLWRWGHAMARPTPGFRNRARLTPPEPLFLAHSDQGLPLFEDAHHFGVVAAEAAMRTLGHPHRSLLEPDA